MPDTFRDQGPYAAKVGKVSGRHELVRELTPAEWRSELRVPWRD